MLPYTLCGEVSLCFCLILHSFSGRFDLLSITEVSSKLQRRHRSIRSNRFEVLVEFVHQRSASRNFKTWNYIIWNTLDVLDNGSDRVPMGRHKYSFAFFQLWLNGAH